MFAIGSRVMIRNSNKEEDKAYSSSGYLSNGGEKE